MNGLIEHDVVQNSPEWYAARLGVITASQASVCRRGDGLTKQQRIYANAIRTGKTEAQARELAGYKAQPKFSQLEQVIEGTLPLLFSEAGHTYAKQIARERCGGREPEGFQGLAQRMGHEEEENAAIAYLAKTGRETRKCGFFSTPDRLFGMSPDRLVVGANGAIEIKTMVSNSTLWSAMVDGDISEYRDQCLFGLWLLALDWIDLGLWSPDLTHLEIHTIKRDEDEIQSLEDDLMAFERLCCEYEDKLRARLGLDKRATPPAEPPSEPVKKAEQTYSTQPVATVLATADSLPDSIRTGITFLAGLTFGDDWEEFLPVVTQAHTETLAAMRELCEEVAQRESERAELERLRALAAQQKQDTPAESTQQVLKAEPVTADATDRETPATASPRVGAMGTGQPADAGPAGERPRSNPSRRHPG